MWYLSVIRLVTDVEVLGLSVFRLVTDALLGVIVLVDPIAVRVNRADNVLKLTLRG